MDQIAQGAEAIIYKELDTIIKDRFAKSYRHPELDLSLRQFRTRREAKVIQKLTTLGFPAPKLFLSDDKVMRINMEFLEGIPAKDIFDHDFKKLTAEMGRNIALLHQNDVIHGDLTTSNMIVGDKLKFIDFGLSFFSDKIEDKAVDLHLLDRALESKHYLVYPDAINLVLNAYRGAYPKAPAVLKRLETVRLRGRNKAKY